ncbi:MAG: Eco57I restriction-modification methylase domain-containing protein [Verrucomicrobiia bacterium]
MEILNWGNPSDLSEKNLYVGYSVKENINFIPIAEIGEFPVFLVKLKQDRLPGLTYRRAIINAISKQNAENLVCFVTSDKKQISFVRSRKISDNISELRSLSYERNTPARTTVERLEKLAFTFDELGKDDTYRITNITSKLDNAFNVQEVTKQFFSDYCSVCNDLQSILNNQLKNKDPRWAHDFSLQFLNRLMFLYFIQKKRFHNGEYWLGNNQGFIKYFWESYKKANNKNNSFYQDWLAVLFFEAFNNKFQAGRADLKYLPEDIRSALAIAPYLNGGLFTANELDEKYEITIPDEFFVSLFDKFNSSEPGFLERYNFTISESTPFDIEVAVDPEMIGKVYESLVNVTTEGISEVDKRGGAGIFYTPRVEIDLMCRLALVDYLSNHLGYENKNLLYDLVFAREINEKEIADKKIEISGLWGKLNDLLCSATVCDPACGSGSFLVGMLLVLDDLQERANRYLNIQETPYERRRRIIGQQLYGVDVMEWAAHIAELRLWLQLTVETEINKEESHLKPVLPNLSFKIRCGDSLVQEIGGINFSLHRNHIDIPSTLKKRITELKEKKYRFYQGDKNLRLEDLKSEEIRLFRDILEQRQTEFKKKIAAINQQIESTLEQGELDGIGDGNAKKEKLDLQNKLIAERNEKQTELDRVDQALQALKTQKTPFIWDVAFVEIFEDEKNGFDIVIGNPPYVRQEMIAPPLVNPEDYGGETSANWRKIKDNYKASLQKSVAAAYPKFFGYNISSAKFKEIDRKSDLYVYFYLHGLSLLNQKGSFCFITSNSWLDVGYGKDLQEFLLTCSHVKLVLDNQVKRSFAQADVNTIIILLAPPLDRPPVNPTNGPENKPVRFVMFKKPYEDLFSSKVFKDIESSTERQNNDDYRVSVRTHSELWQEGIRVEDDEGTEKIKSKRPFIPQYTGNKWGGKYLRAPDIYFTILEKGKGKLVRLGDIAEVRFGIKTGANEFFYLKPVGMTVKEVVEIAEKNPDALIRVKNGAGWEGEIEARFLKPVIKSPRELKTIVVRLEDLNYLVFMCHEPKSKLAGTKALEYIKWGEKQGYQNRPSCKGREKWWDLEGKKPWRIIFTMYFQKSFKYHLNTHEAYVDNTLYESKLNIGDEYEQIFTFLLNTSIYFLYPELFGRNYGGGGAPVGFKVYEIPSLFILDPRMVITNTNFIEVINRFMNRIIQPVLLELGFDPKKPIREQEPNPLPDRKALDDIVFDTLGLIEEERREVYWSVAELVKTRLEKAKSVEEQD